MIFQSWLESVLDPKQRRSKSQKRLTRLFKLPKIAREEPWRETAAGDDRH